MYSVLVILQIFVVILLIGLVLIQPNSSSGTANLMSTSSVNRDFSSSSFFTKMIIILGAIFIINNLVLAKVSSKGRKFVEKEYSKLYEKEEPAEDKVTYAEEEKSVSLK